MNFKNIVTNFLGLIFWGLSVYEYFNDKSLLLIFCLVVIGGALFLFENKKLKDVLDRIINKKIDG